MRDSSIEKRFQVQLSNEGVPVSCDGTVRYSSRQDALLLSAKVLTAGLVITLLSVFIPIVHFVSVPLGVIFTPLLAFVAYRKVADQMALSVRYTCHSSACKREVSHTSSGRTKRREALCPWCKASYEIHIEETSIGAT